LAIALILVLFAPRSLPPVGAAPGGAPRWWPDWKDPAIWLLGFAFGGNNALFYGINAFLPDYLVSIGSPDLTGAALALMHGCQPLASARGRGPGDSIARRGCPSRVLGLAAFAGVLGIMGGCGVGVVIAAAFFAFPLAVTLLMALPFPRVLSPPDDIPRLS